MAKDETGSDGGSMPAGAPQQEDTAKASSAIELLKADHRAVEGMFAQYEKAQEAQKTQIIEQVCKALVIHTMLEEQVFYPACRKAASDEEPLDEAQVEHDGAKVLITDLLSGNDKDQYRDAKVKVLSEQIKHHVGEEEAPTKGIFAKAKSAGVDTPELAQRIRELKQRLEARQGELSPSALVSIHALAGRDRRQQEEEMPRQGPERDERGRFISDDDDRGYRSRGYDRDDDRGYRSRGRDDDDGRGWYGDSEGHSEASRRGWAERRGETRSFRRDDDDDDRRSYRGQDRDRDERGRFMSDDDDRGGGYRSRGRDERGRFADDDDRGYRSRGRDVDDDRGYRSRGGGDRGQGGWFGDSRGHAEAARRGWEERDGGRGGRSRDDDDDRRYSSRSSRRDDDRGQGGWFGDSRGHAEAARRGWENRR